MKEIRIVEGDISELLKKLGKNKFPQPERIIPWELKESATEFVKPLKITFRESVTTGVVSRDWKTCICRSNILEGRLR